jgi:predicted nucleotidyltransferase
MNDTLCQRLGVSEMQLVDLCRRRKIIGMAVFGSAFRDDCQADSDVDLLVQVAPDTGVACSRGSSGDSMTSDGWNA